MPEEQIVRMTTVGWVFMVASWVAITALVTYCFVRLFASGGHLGPGETPLE